jgi:elongation factor G
VDDGRTATDCDPDEIQRKISLGTSVAFCDWKGYHFNLIDTPGYGDFVADARAGLRVVTAAVVVVDAVAGVQVQTEKIWKYANEYGLPRAIVINRLDRERADFYRTLESLQKRLKGRLCPLQVPIGAEASFKGVVDLMAMKALLTVDGKVKESDIPGDIMDDVKAWREKLMEAVAETDDDLLAKYLEDGGIEEEEMLTALGKAISAGSLVPVLGAAATKGIGVQPLLDLLVKEFPSPAESATVEGTDPRTKQAVTRAADTTAPLPAVDSNQRRSSRGQALAFRVYWAPSRPTARSQRDAGSQGAHVHVGWLQARRRSRWSPWDPGRRGGGQAKDTLTGDTLCDEASPVALPGIVFPEPAISFAIQPKTRGDEDKISTALHRMTEEDPTLHHHFDPETKQLLVSGMGQLHVETVVERMKRKYNVDVSVLPPRIPLRRRAVGASEAGRAKQTGAGASTATCGSRSSLQRGGGFEFVDDIFGAQPRNFIRPWRRACASA